MEMMWSTLTIVMSWMTHSMIEFSLFLVVDSVIKACLHSVRDPLERRRMWFLESLVLLVLATFMSHYDCVPYVLYSLGFSTIVFALLHNQIDLQNFLPSKLTYREAFDKNNVNNGVFSSFNNSSQSESFQKSKIVYVEPACALNGKDQMQQKHQNCTTALIRVNRENFVTKLMSYFQALLQRKPTGCAPPGLPNKGMNLCFLNSVLQCLAHVQSHCGIDEVLSLMRDNCKEMDLIGCYSELIAGCTLSQCSFPVLDTFAFRKAAYGLCPSLIADPSIHKQTQQDAAEFLTWLLTSLHDVLRNTASPKGLYNLQTNSGVENLSENDQHSLKAECQMLLQTSKSMYDKRCVKAVQVLSDLDWIYQQSHDNSIVNKLFCGQLLELREDGFSNCISIGIQPFSVLPVPLSGPRQLSGVVYLQDCISDMCALNDILVESPYVSFAYPSIKHETDLGNTANGPSILIPYVSTSTPTKPEILTSQGSSEYKSSSFRCQTSLRHLPKCLILQLNRFNQYGHKVKTPVNIPLHGLNLTPTLFDQQVAGEPVSIGPMYIYDLAALCVHEGAESTCYGHYVAFCMTSNGQWYRMDDEIVSKVNMVFECNSPLVRENAYLLFYVKRN